MEEIQEKDGSWEFILSYPAEFESLVDLNPRQARLLQINIVVIVKIVDTDDLIATLQQAQCQGGADETRGPRNQNSHMVLLDRRRRASPPGKRPELRDDTGGSGRRAALRG